MKRLKISLDRRGESAYQISLSVLDENDNGHGYRLLGPKYLGNSTLVRQSRPTRSASSPTEATGQTGRR